MHIDNRIIQFINVLQIVEIWSEILNLLCIAMWNGDTAALPNDYIVLSVSNLSVWYIY